MPQSLKKTGLFCVWRYEQRGGKRTKVPYNPVTGEKIRPNNAATFTTLAACLAAPGGYDGIGVGVFNPVCAIDIDHCIGSDGKMSEMCADIVATMNSYTEYSPSGTGIRILFTAPGFAYDKQRFYINNRNCGLEVYVAGSTKKYVTVTGNALAVSGPNKQHGIESPVFEASTPAADNRSMEMEERGAELQIVLDKYMRRKLTEKKQSATPDKPINLSDDAVLEKAMRAANSVKFLALWHGDISDYQSQSEAELALCSYLALHRP